MRAHALFRPPDMFWKTWREIALFAVNALTKQKRHRHVEPLLGNLRAATRTPHALLNCNWHVQIGATIRGKESTVFGLTEVDLHWKDGLFTS
ncbi:hypothetical protein LshimejAT787_0300860 [Lyophyllum shimeji]|uniref:Uncharacterized protein n=1 Tax=Lyophyllum shimeji TaxID=47721 RepID=A0A9P3UJL5_LYOSH|nr:hypothetical protein LshimejAT787_0300860 [Lyophyllum shimeji]